MKPKEFDNKLKTLLNTKKLKKMKQETTLWSCSILDWMPEMLNEFETSNMLLSDFRKMKVMQCKDKTIATPNTENVDIKFCPFCSSENTVQLKEQQRQHIVKDVLVKGLFYFYKCSSCKGEFTTTKLDEQSLKNFTHKKM